MTQNSQYRQSPEKLEQKRLVQLPDDCPFTQREPAIQHTSSHQTLQERLADAHGSATPNP